MIETTIDLKKRKGEKKSPNEVTLAKALYKTREQGNFRSPEEGR